MNGDIQTKAVVSISEMARMVGLSRARFAQLRATTFPHPIYDIATRRPFFTEELQRICIEVRKRNVGIDGKPVLFYARRLGQPTSASKPKTKVSSPMNNQHADLVDGLKALGLAAVTPAQVKMALTELHKQDTTGQDQGELLRQVFLFLKRQDTAGNVRR